MTSRQTSLVLSTEHNFGRPRESDGRLQRDEARARNRKFGSGAHIRAKPGSEDACREKSRRTLLPIGFPIVSLDELRAVDILEPIKGDSEADCGDFEWAYLRAAEAARASGRHSAAKAFGLMAALCSLHFRPEDPAGPYGPGATGGGRLTAVPEDFRGEQSRILETFIADVGHAGLRGRIADVVWINDKSRTIAANAAIDAYCGTIEDLNRGIYCPGFDHPTRAMFEKRSIFCVVRFR